MLATFRKGIKNIANALFFGVATTLTTAVRGIFVIPALLLTSLIMAASITLLTLFLAPAAPFSNSVRNILSNAYHLLANIIKMFANEVVTLLLSPFIGLYMGFTQPIFQCINNLKDFFITLPQADRPFYNNPLFNTETDPDDKTPFVQGTSAIIHQSLMQLQAPTENGTLYIHLAHWPVSASLDTLTMPNELFTMIKNVCDSIKPLSEEEIAYIKQFTSLTPEEIDDIFKNYSYEKRKEIKELVNTMKGCMDEYERFQSPACLIVADVLNEDGVIVNNYSLHPQKGLFVLPGNLFLQDPDKLRMLKGVDPETIQPFIHTSKMRAFSHTYNPKNPVSLALSNLTNQLRHALEYREEITLALSIMPPSKASQYRQTPSVAHIGMYGDTTASETLSIGRQQSFYGI